MVGTDERDLYKTRSSFWATIMGHGPHEDLEKTINSAKRRQMPAPYHAMPQIIVMFVTSKGHRAENIRRDQTQFDFT